MGEMSKVERVAHAMAQRSDARVAGMYTINSLPMDGRENFLELAKAAIEEVEAARSGTQYSFGLVWRNSPESKTSTSLGPYSDKATGEGEFAETLVKLGYCPPRWWQYWRWGESRPSERVLRLMEWMKPDGRALKE